MKKFLLAFGIILALAVSITAATTNFNQTHETTISTEKDGDCEKCGKKDCKGDCTTEKKCTKGATKSCCKKGNSKKACTGKTECKKGEAKKACTHKKVK